MANEIPIGTLMVKLLGDASHFERMIAKSESAVAQFGRRLSQEGRNLSAILTAPLVGVAALGLKTFTDFDRGLTRAVALMGDAIPVTAKIRREMEQMAVTVSNQSTSSVGQLSTAYEELASKGYNAQQAMQNLNAVDKIAIAYHVDHKRAVDLLVNSFRELGQDRTLALVAEATAVADKEMQSLGSQLENTWRQLENVAMEIGESLVPYLKQLAKWLREGTQWWRSLEDSQKGAAIGVGVFLAGLGPALAALGSLISVLGVVVPFFIAWGPAILSVSGFLLGWTAVAAIVVGSLVMLSDALLGTDSGLLKFVNDFRVGGYKISTWSELVANKVYLEFDLMWKGVTKLAHAAWVSIREIGGYIFRFLLNVAREVEKGYTKVLNFFGIVTASEKDLKSIEDSWNALIESSLNDAADRQADYYRDVNRMAREHLDLEKAFAADSVALVKRDQAEKQAAVKQTGRAAEASRQVVAFGGARVGDADTEAALKSLGKGMIGVGKNSFDQKFLEEQSKAYHRAASGPYVEGLQKSLGGQGFIGAAKNSDEQRMMDFIGQQHKAEYLKGLEGSVNGSAKTAKDKGGIFSFLGGIMAPVGDAVKGLVAQATKPPTLPVAAQAESSLPGAAAVAARGSFEATNLRRFTVSRVGGADAAASQGVKDEETHKRLDTLIDLTRGRTVPAVLSP